MQQVNSNHPIPREDLLPTPNKSRLKCEEYDCRVSDGVLRTKLNIDFKLNVNPCKDYC